MDLALRIYDVSEDWPAVERYGLASQLRRAATSVPGNIAEGRGRLGAREFRHHVSIANGSLCEVETYVELASRRGYIDEETTEELFGRCQELAKVIWGLLRSLDIKSSPKQ
jgi:four helix bundle protein